MLYPAGIELIVAFYGCLYVGVVPVIIRPPQISNLPASLPTMKLTIEISNSRALLTCHPVMRVLKSKEATTNNLDLKTLPPILETDDLSKKKLERFYRAPTAELIAYLDFSVSTTGVLSGVKVRSCVGLDNGVYLCVGLDLSWRCTQHVSGAQACV